MCISPMWDWWSRSILCYKVVTRPECETASASRHLGRIWCISWALRGIRRIFVDSVPPPGKRSSRSRSQWSWWRRPFLSIWPWRPLQTFLFQRPETSNTNTMLRATKLGTKPRHCFGCIRGAFCPRDRLDDAPHVTSKTSPTTTTETLLWLSVNNVQRLLFFFLDTGYNSNKIRGP